MPPRLFLETLWLHWFVRGSAFRKRIAKIESHDNSDESLVSRNDSNGSPSTYPTKALLTRWRVREQVGRTAFQEELGPDYG